MSRYLLLALALLCGRDETYTQDDPAMRSIVCERNDLTLPVSSRYLCGRYKLEELEELGRERDDERRRFDEELARHDAENKQLWDEAEKRLDDIIKYHIGDHVEDK